MQLPDYVGRLHIRVHGARGLPGAGIVPLHLASDILHLLTFAPTTTTTIINNYHHQQPTTEGKVNALCKVQVTKKDKCKTSEVRSLSPTWDEEFKVYPPRAPVMMTIGHGRFFFCLLF
jgi:hypothetical protein